MNDWQGNRRPIQVLVVDDRAFMRSALTRMIDSGVELKVSGTAQNGMQALERIVELQPDMVPLLQIPLEILPAVHDRERVQGPTGSVDSKTSLTFTSRAAAEKGLGR